MSKNKIINVSNHRSSFSDHRVYFREYVIQIKNTLYNLCIYMYLCFAPSLLPEIRFKLGN